MLLLDTQRIAASAHLLNLFPLFSLPLALTLWMPPLSLSIPFHILFYLPHIIYTHNVDFFCGRSFVAKTIKVFSIIRETLVGVNSMSYLLLKTNTHTLISRYSKNRDVSFISLRFFFSFVMSFYFEFLYSLFDRLSSVDDFVNHVIVAISC